MRTVCILLLCLLALPAAAASFDPGAVPAGVIRTHPTTLPAIPTVPTTIPPAEAWLTIYTDPEGATAIIDSAKTVTNTNRVVLTPGSHTIVVIRSGYQDYATKVNLKGGTWTDLRVTLEPAPDAGKFRPLVTTGTLAAATTQPYLTRPASCRLDIISYPSGAKVYLNGSDTFETTPVTIYPNPGTYTVKLTHPNYADFVTNVTLGAGEAVIIETEMFDTGPEMRLFLPNETIEIRGRPVVGEPDEDDDACMPGQQCQTAAGAQALYPQGGCTGGNIICGNETLPDGTLMPKFCCTPPAGGAPAAAPQAPGAEKQGGVIESIASFFSRLFGR